ncbi:hypothetical protein XELAEV_18005775mg [Xenopus laevis]|uniref:USP domain-containing protein n=1 Tax=Xenopus laevis TaxID=8355 RepID=A0A974I2Y5_XENLA|nr:hypothetical protein XELAEV_18005775mg [Xenopus laevis]
MCLNCLGESNTFDKFMDIQLDIKNSNSITEALKEYVKPEELRELCYKCSKCNEMVTATKTLYIKRPSNVLTLSLNRFDVFSANKISKMVAYPEFIDIRPYTSEPNGEPITYRLYAVLLHAGNTCNSGHYYCYVKRKYWYRTKRRKGKGLKRPFPDITSSETPSTFPTASSSLQKPINSQPEGIKRIKLDRSLLFKTSRMDGKGDTALVPNRSEMEVKERVLKTTYIKAPSFIPTATSSSQQANTSQPARFMIQPAKPVFQISENTDERDEKQKSLKRPLPDEEGSEETPKKKICLTWS